MAKYNITEQSYIGDALVTGEITVPDDTVPGSHWEPLDKAAKKAFADKFGEDAVTHPVPDPVNQAGFGEVAAV